jgi:GTP pyrophosphokinase
MNSIAERGVAAHWMYKKGESSPSGEVEIDIWLKHVRDILEDPDSNALQFLDNFHKELLSSDIYIFTPKGESKTLPKGSTALDFAYNIHTQVGNKAIAAKVNQKLLPLSHVLSNGDQVEIITSDSGKPKREWLNFVRTNRARNFILDSIKAETKDSIKEGMRFLTSKLKERNITSKSRVLKKLIDYYKAGSKDELYHKIGIGLIDLSDLETALKTNVEKRNVQMWGVKLLTPVRNTGIIDKQQDYELREDLSKGTTTFTIAECCSPIPGDNVVGFIEDDGSVLVHKKSCQKATDIAAKQGDRIVSAKWSKHFMMSYLARISITGLDRMGIISDMSKVISLQLGVNMRKICIETHDEIFEGTVDLYVRNTDDLDKLIKSLSAIKGIESVTRVELNFNE